MKNRNNANKQYIDAFDLSASMSRGLLTISPYLNMEQHLCVEISNYCRKRHREAEKAALSSIIDDERRTMRTRT